MRDSRCNTKAMNHYSYDGACICNLHGTSFILIMPVKMPDFGVHHWLRGM